MNLENDEIIIKKYCAFEGIKRFNTKCDVTVTNKRINITTIGSKSGKSMVDIGDYSIKNVSAVTTRYDETLNLPLLIFGVLLFVLGLVLFVSNRAFLFVIFSIFVSMVGILIVVCCFLFKRKYAKVTIMGIGFETITYVGSNVRNKKTISLGTVKPGPDFKLLQEDIMAVILSIQTNKQTLESSNKTD